MKNRHNISTLIFFFFFSLFSFGQSGDFIKANKAFDNAEFGKAETIFKRAYDRSDDRNEKNEIGFKLAQCYFYLGNYKKAESNFRRAIKMRYDNPAVHFYLAECYKAMEKFEKAEEQYKIYVELNPDDPKGLIGLESLRISQEWVLDGSKYRVVNAGSINSSANDFSPALRHKSKKEEPKLYFTSSRDGSLGKSINHKTGQLFTDIFCVPELKPKKAKKKKATSNIIPPPWKVEDLTNLEFGLRDVINMKNSDDGVVTFNQRGSRMFFTRAVFEKNQYQGRRIYSAPLKNSGFGPAVMELIPIDTLVDVHGPSLSADEKTLFFAAEIEGGFGGTDIYVTRYDRRKKSWGTPENLGPNVNTAGNEGFPHFNTQTQNLYFSSDGRVGMGGLDIYKAEHNPSSDGAAKSMFLEAENLRYPINTSFDDFGIVFESDPVATEPELKGYFSSNRTGKQWRSKGKTDIYYFDKQQIFFTLEGTIIDVADGLPIQGAKVELIGPSSSKIALTNGRGEFSFDESNFEEGEDYRIVVNKDWFFQVVDTTITTRSIKKRDCEIILDESNRHGHLSYDMTRDIELRTMRRPLVLKSVLFDLGKSDLRNESKQELDSLASLLNNDWPNVVVELRSHTDFRGSDTLNTRLSYDRALSCVNYLVEQGVDSNRLVPVGMADTEPVVLEESEFGLPVGVLDRAYINNLKSKKMIKLAHQKNRRTDFKILSDDFESWIEDNPNLKKGKKPLRNAAINQDGEVVPMKKSSGNFIQQIN